MKIVCTSDLHGNLIDIEGGDLLLLGGDITPRFDADKEDLAPIQLQWMDKTLRPWLDKLDFKYVVATSGNHDMCLQSNLQQVTDMNLHWHLLMDQEITIDGFKIYGSPWTKWFYDWAFNLYEEDLEKKWSLIPNDTDILLLHQPPKGYGDLANVIVAGKTVRGIFEHAGSPSLTKRIEEIKPKLVVFGHLHLGYGLYQTDSTTFVNAAAVDQFYNPKNKPVVIEL